MAGYNGFSMSNNAVAAYRQGLVPASKIKGVPAALVKEFCSPSEWHHMSKQYNCTDFFDPEDVLIEFGLDPKNGKDLSAYDGKAKTWADLGNKSAMNALEKYKLDKKEAKTVIYKDCLVNWLNWGGTLKRPTCSAECRSEATVSVRGKTATISFVEGGGLTKRLDTRGFDFVPEYTKQCKKIATRKKQYEQECVSRGGKLPASLQQTFKFSDDKAWAAVRVDGQRVLDVKTMNLAKSGSKSSFFGEYREECKTALAKKGVVVSGFVTTIKNKLYFIPYTPYKNLKEAIEAVKNSSE